MKTIVKKSDVPIENVIEGINRRIMGYDESLMVVWVKFDEGTVAPRHSHPHQQVTYIERGTFRVEIEGVWTELQAGDTFVIPSNAMHHGKAVTECILIDTFSPKREDFLSQ